MFTASGMAGGNVMALSQPAPFIFDQYFGDWLASNTGYTVVPLYTPQKAAFPILTYAQSGLQRNHTTAGTAGLTEATYAITAWTTNYMDSLIMAGVLYSVLDSFKGSMTYASGSVTVEGAFSVEEHSDYTPPVADGETGVHQRVCIYHVFYVEPKSTPTVARGG